MDRRTGGRAEQLIFIMDLKTILQGIEPVVREAGRRLLDVQETPQINFQDNKDVKLQADLDSEEFLRDALVDIFEAPIVGEEIGGDAKLAIEDRPYWVIDPLDGTYNYMRKSPLCCISIGLLQGTRPLLGVVYDFNTETFYAGIPGEGLWINGESHRPQWEYEKTKAALMTGFPAGSDHSGPVLEAFLREIQEFKKVRMNGCAALALTNVAMGQADAYWENSTNLWDSAGGIALVLAAGGHINVELKAPGESFRCNTWACSNKDWIHAKA